MQTYQVFIQEIPIRNERTKNWEVNLVPVNTVQARNSNEAMMLAKRYTNHPVIEKLKG